MKKQKLLGKLNDFIMFVDKLPLWWLGFVLLFVTFLPYFILQGGSVFEIHDQMDETMLTYVLSGKYLGSGLKVFPEMLGGINASGMQPSAVLFIPLYKVLPTLVAFLLQYAIVCISGFMGMYFSVKELTKSSILAVVGAACFCLLPIQPVYGLSVLGVPLLLYVFLCLYQRKHLIWSLLLIIFWGLTTHLVLIGYVVLSFWALALLIMLIRNNKNIWVWVGFLLLTTVYVVVNHSLFYELIMGKGEYISHRAELVNYAVPFWESVKGVFLNSAQHAPSLHQYLILPIMVMLIIGGIRYPKLNQVERKRYVTVVAGMVLLIGIALLYGICKSTWMVNWKNSISGFLRYFQLERYYWLYPAGWYLEFILCFGMWWQGAEEYKRNPPKALWQMPLCKLLVLALLLLPTIDKIKISSYFYMNVNQINNGSGVTGYISWESYYAEDLMEQLDKEIGRDKTTYRVAHLGINPAPSLMHGFYTVDGYSNNYPLEYKHQFRKVIEAELDKNEQTRLYFDEWGSRCYLFNGTTGMYWNMSKWDDISYEKLEINTDALEDLGCEYLFSGGEILNAEDIGLKSMGYFETDNSYWGIWLYSLCNL